MKFILFKQRNLHIKVNPERIPGFPQGGVDGKWMRATGRQKEFPTDKPWICLLSLFAQLTDSKMNFRIAIFHFAFLLIHYMPKIVAATTATIVILISWNLYWKVFQYIIFKRRPFIYLNFFNNDTLISSLQFTQGPYSMTLLGENRWRVKGLNKDCVFYALNCCEFLNSARSSENHNL